MNNLQKSNRRTFLKSAILGTTGAFIARRGMSIPGTSTGTGEIITRKLGKTGMEIPVLSMGVMRADNPNLVKAALKEGIKLFDTAHSYQQGRNEEMLGNIFKDLPRDSFFVTTKIKPEDVNRDGTTGDGSTAEKFLARLDTSLTRLQIDHVDILLQHGVDTRQALLFEPVLDAMQTAKKQGKTRFIGVSTHRNEPEVIEAAIESGVIDVVLTAINFKQDHYPELKKTIAKAADHGIGIIGMKNLAGGFLDEEKQKPVNAKAAIKWVLQDPNVTTCIPGFTAFDHIQEDKELLTNIDLTQDELDSLKLASNEMGMYCQGCRKCLTGCKKSLPVPDIMRAYMYAYGYGEFEKAQTLLNDYNIPVNPCAGCLECTVQCSKGFPVAEKIARITRLRDVPKDFVS